MTKDLVDRILVEKEGFAFFVDVIYERLPLFCSSCKIVGHSSELCKRRPKREETKKIVTMPSATRPVKDATTPHGKDDEGGQPVLTSGGQTIAAFGDQSVVVFGGMADKDGKGQPDVVVPIVVPDKDMEDTCEGGLM